MKTGRWGIPRVVQTSLSRKKYSPGDREALAGLFPPLGIFE
jgi:hypothetical protein